MLLLFLVGFCSKAAFAYIGPGSGLSVLGAIAAVIGALVFGIVGLVWYPFKRLFRFLADRKNRRRE